MTLIQTAKLNGVEPMENLTEVPERTVFGQTETRALPTSPKWN